MRLHGPSLASVTGKGTSSSHWTKARPLCSAQAVATAARPQGVGAILVGVSGDPVPNRLHSVPSAMDRQKSHASTASGSKKETCGSGSGERFWSVMPSRAKRALEDMGCDGSADFAYMFTCQDEAYGFGRQLDLSRDDSALVEAAWQIARNEASLTEEVIRSGIVQSIQRGRQLEAKAAPRLISASSRTLPAPRVRPVITAAMYSVQDELMLGPGAGRGRSGLGLNKGEDHEEIPFPWHL